MTFDLQQKEINMKSPHTKYEKYMYHSYFTMSCSYFARLDSGDSGGILLRLDVQQDKLQ